MADPATTEDILHDVFLKIQGRLDTLEDSAKLQSWLYLIARNAIIDHYRTRKGMTALALIVCASHATAQDYGLAGHC